MNSERSQAYGRVMRTLTDLGPSKLLPNEQERVRAAADGLLFSDDARDEATVETLAAVRELTAHLVATERWSDTSATALRDDLEACGPVQLVG
ncbi:hypothetical protein OJ998_17005 [Solirubrobacter taibaiensis]|nr:hypothetical protein [Solirubrobacter taibaiensis]